MNDKREEGKQKEFSIGSNDFDFIAIYFLLYKDHKKKENGKDFSRKNDKE